MVENREFNRIRYAVVGLGHIAQAAVLPAFEHASGLGSAIVTTRQGKHNKQTSREETSVGRSRISQQELSD